MTQPNRTLDIVYGKMFPWYFQVVATGLVLGGVIALTAGNLVLGVILLIIAGLIFTAHEGTEIDPVAKTFREYQSFFYIKTGKPQRYNAIEKIFINAGRVSSTAHTAYTNHSASFSSDEFRAFLKFDSGEKIALRKASNKEKIFREMGVLANRLETELVDGTGQG